MPPSLSVFFSVQGKRTGAFFPRLGWGGSFKSLDKEIDWLIAHHMLERSEATVVILGALTHALDPSKATGHCFPSRTGRTGTLSSKSCPTYPPSCPVPCTWPWLPLGASSFPPSRAKVLCCACGRCGAFMSFRTLI